MFKRLFLPISYWLTILIFWTLVRIYIPTSEPVEEIFFKPIIWLLPLLYFWPQIPRKAQLSFWASFQKIRPVAATILLPFIGTLAYALLVNVASLHIPSVAFPALLLLLLTNSMTAIVEEIVFRGILLPWIAQVSSTSIASILIQVLFYAIHIPVLILHSPTIASALIHSIFIFIMGGIYTYIYVKTKSIPAAIIAHATWNTIAAFLQM